MLWYAKTTLSIPKIMRFLIGQRSDILSLKSLARSRLKCWTGWKCKRRTGQGHLSIFPASCHGLILKHWILMRQVQSCEQFPRFHPVILNAVKDLFCGSIENKQVRL